MCSDPVAINVDRVSKCYEIYSKPHHRLMQTLCLGRRRFYKAFWALRDISFQVNRGETVGIVGRNGSGKSTLLQIVCGTLSPSTGKVNTRGRVAALLELGAGFNPEFTGRENIYLNGAILGFSRQEITSHFDRIAAFADIGDFIDQPVDTYSSGMVVRLAFALAIHVNPDILIVDEALSVGDEAFQRKCFARIEAIRQNGTTILFCSHSASTIVELCDRALILDAGEKLTIGKPKTVVAQYQKLIYAPPEKRLEIRNGIATSRSRAKASNSGHDERTRGSQTEAKDFLDPHLKPKSTVAYASRGQHIHSPSILTLSGRPVNCLIRGRSYRYVYQVTFTRRAHNVRFAMLIKTVSGI